MINKRAFICIGIIISLSCNQNTSNNSSSNNETSIGLDSNFENTGYSAQKDVEYEYGFITDLKKDSFSVDFVQISLESFKEAKRILGSKIGTTIAAKMMDKGPVLVDSMYYYFKNSSKNLRSFPTSKINSFIQYTDFECDCYYLDTIHDFNVLMDLKYYKDNLFYFKYFEGNITSIEQVFIENIESNHL